MRSRGVLLFAVCALFRAPLVWGQPTIIEYPLTTAVGNPTVIVKGPDGNLWALTNPSNRIAKITPSGTITSYAFPSGSLPATLAAGPDGNVWFADPLGNTVGKITPDGVITGYPLPARGSSPLSITAGPDGNVWFTEFAGIGKITSSGTLTEFPYSGAGAITAGPDGNLWFTVAIRDSVARITPAGSITEFHLLAAEPAGATLSPGPIALGPDGNLWVTGTGTAWRITPAGTAVPFPVPQPGAITAGADGNLWLTEINANKIVKLTTSGTFTEYSVPDAEWIAAGPDGNIWFTETSALKVGKVVLSTVPPDQLLSLNQTSLTFTAAVYGSAPSPQTLSVSAPAGTSFRISANAQFSPPWLSITPSGNLVAPQDISVNVNQSNLGTYGAPLFGFILLTSNNVTQTVLVTLTLTPPVAGGDIKVQPTSLSFSYTTPQGSPPLDQQIVITDVNPLSGSIPLTISYTISSPSGLKWLTLTQGGNPIPSGGAKTSPVGIYGHVDPTGLSPGTYNATVTIVPTGGATVNIPVTLTVTASPNPTTMSVTPSALTFVWQQGTISPPTQYVQLSESGPQFSWAAQSDSPSWLSVTPVAANSPATLTISVIPTALAAGTYTGTVTITLPLLAGVSAKITVSLTVLPASSQPFIQEYTLPTVSAGPNLITSGPDGNLWFTEIWANKIGKITTAGSITEYPLPQTYAVFGIAAGTDGALWFTESGVNRIGRITTAGSITEYAVPTPSATPQWITAGPDGAVWFSETGSFKIGRISTGGAVVEFTISTYPDTIASGPGGVWFSERFTGRLGRITTSGTVQEFPLLSGNNDEMIYGLAMDRDGNLWVATTNAVWKVTGAGAATPYFLPTRNSLAVGITAGPDGNMWFAGDTGNKIVRLSPDGVFTGFPLPIAGSAAEYVTTGPDGNLWFTESTGNRMGKLLVSAAPAAALLNLSQPSLTFTAAVGGGAPPAQTLTITAAVSKPLMASASVVGSASWLTISPSGNLTTGQTITVSVNQSALPAPGSYIGNISLTSGNVTQTVLVTLNLTPPGGNVSVSPASLSFSSLVGDGTSAAQNLLISNATPGTGPIPVTISGSVQSPGGGKWLILPATSGTTANTSPMAIPVLVDSTGLAAGAYKASLTITPTGGSAVTVPVTLTVAARPAITAVMNAASFIAGFGNPSVAPGEIVTIAGSGLGPATPAGLALDSTGRVASSLGGVTVTFNGYAAPLTYVSATQINCVVPYEVAGANDVLVQVSYATQSAALALKNISPMPGIFTLNGSGMGPVAAANSTGGYNGPDNPAPAGSAITFYLTGEGQTNPAGVTGKITTMDTSSGGPLTPQPLAGAPAVTIGGQPATVLFYGEAPEMVAGIMQLNVGIPAGLPSGVLPLLVSLGAASSRTGVTVAIR